MAAPKFPTTSVGPTNKAKADGFIRVNVTGYDNLIAEFHRVFKNLDPKRLRYLLRKAAEPIKKSYQAKAAIHDATGNLQKATKIKFKAYDASAVAIAGPENTGTSGATNERPSGNHAWLVEFGSQPRKPGSSGRRQYINTHKTINNRMSSHRVMSSDQFAKESQGVYFLMGSKNEPTRQARMGKGYTHDFMTGPDGKMHPMTLGPDETYGKMPALGLMQQAIREQHSNTTRMIADAVQELLVANAFSN